MWSSPINQAVVDELGIRAGERVVDIGAGMGAGTVLAAREDARVVAVEPTPFLRTVLRMRRLGQRARRYIEVRDGAAEDLPVPDASVDAVWAVNVMHHWTDGATAVGELSRVVRRGGRVLLIDESFDDPAHPEHDAVSARRGRDNLHFDHVDPALVGDSLAIGGFTVHEAASTTVRGRPAKVIRATKS
jgi:ubiquinone/menaquinone biosynthesis C-methylase UbiE